MSQATGCLLVVCWSRGQGQEPSCNNYTLQRTPPSYTVRFDEMGTYVVSEVADIEQDGTVNMVEDISVFGLLEASLLSPPAATTTPSECTVVCASFHANTAPMQGLAVQVASLPAQQASVQVVF